MLLLITHLRLHSSYTTVLTVITYMFKLHIFFFGLQPFSFGLHIFVGLNT